MKNLKIKKLLAVAVAGILTVGLVACGSSNSDSAKSDTASGSDAASGSYRTLDEIKEDGTYQHRCIFRQKPIWLCG